MRTQARVKASTCLLMGCLWFSAQSSDATTATWINTANGGYWTNAVNWNASQYPGQDGANQNAFLTNRADGVVYKAVVDTTLPYTVGTVEIKNLGAGGEAWLIVTNTVFAATNLLIRAGGRLQIDNGGVVTNLPGFTLDGTNGQMIVNNGGSLFSSNNVFMGSGSGGRSNVLSLGDNAVFAVTNGYLIMGNGAGADGNRLLVPGNNVRMRTTANSCVIGSGSANNMALFTGTNIVWTYGSSSQMRFGQQAGGNSNTLMVSQGSVSILGSTLNIGLSGGSSYNALIVTNGGRLFTQSTVGAGYSTSNNLILVTGSGSLWDGGNSCEKSGDSGNANVNRIVVDQNGTVSNAYVYVGTASSQTFNNVLTLTNGAQWFESGGDSIIGYGGTNNSAVVTGSNTLWNLGARTLTVGGANTNNSLNWLLLDAGAMITNGPVLVGAGAYAFKNTLTVTNGGQLFTGTSASIIGNPASNNLMLVTGAGSLWNCNKQDVKVGSGASAVGNALRIENSALVTNVNALYVGSSGGFSNSLTVTKGGQCWVALGQSCYVGNVASSNSVWVSEAGSVLGSCGNMTNGNLFVGGTANAAGNAFTVNNGGVSSGWNQLYVGRYGFSSGNTLTITNGGYLQTAVVRVSYQGSNSWNNSLLVMDGGILEAGQNGISVDQANTGPVGNDCITNHAGVYQFTYAAPAVMPVPTNNSYIYLTDGTIAFRGVTGVDVKGNRTGTLTNIVFSGNNNAFRLNNATNATSPDQTYTFANNLGPTNYARLELFNGSLYQGGSVTIGSGGTLSLSGTPSTITNLTIASGGTLEVTVSGTNSASLLNAVGSVALGGTLRIILAAAPPPAGFDWTLISKSGATGMTGAFTGGPVLEQAYQGTNYVFRINAAGGDGNDLVLHSLGRSVPGTVMLVL